MTRISVQIHPIVVETENYKYQPHGGAIAKVMGIVKVSRIYPLGTNDIFTESQGNHVYSRTFEILFLPSLKYKIYSPIKQLWLLCHCLYATLYSFYSVSPCSFCSLIVILQLLDI